MIELYDADVIRSSERRAMEIMDIPEDVLMENAGRGAASRILELYPAAQKLVVFCGPGNNGGDGVVVARHLGLAGRNATVVCCFSESRPTGAMARNLATIEKIGTADIAWLSDTEDVAFSGVMDDCDVVIDALLGTGSKGLLRGRIRRAVDIIRNSSNPVVSLDTPTGVDVSSGRADAGSVVADTTVTMMVSKPGLHVLPGMAFAGNVEIVDIGVPSGFVLPSAGSARLVEQGDVKAILPGRGKTTHKGSRGCVLVVGGSPLYRGAPCLAARGALRAGAGIVFLAQGGNRETSPEALCEVIRIPSEKDGPLGPEIFDATMGKWGGRIDAVVIGPGLGRDESSGLLVSRFWEEWQGPLCIDGDGLHFLTEDGPWRHAKRPKTVVTPHEGEVAALLGVSRMDIAESRMDAARGLAGKFETTVLKGSGTIISDVSGIRIIPPGSVSLSVPGSGDVLAGMTGAFMGMGVDTGQSAAAAAWIHAECGRVLENTKGVDGVLASEIADTIPHVLAATGKGGQ